MPTYRAVRAAQSLRSREAVKDDEMADISLTDAEHVLQDIVDTAGEISAAIQTVIEGKP